MSSLIAVHSYAPLSVTSVTLVIVSTLVPLRFHVVTVSRCQFPGDGSVVLPRAHRSMTGLSPAALQWRRAVLPAWNGERRVIVGLGGAV